jgi:hypothetical protein
MVENSIQGFFHKKKQELNGFIQNHSTKQRACEEFFMQHVCAGL